jgi:hypothetical protein
MSKGVYTIRDLLTPGPDTVANKLTLEKKGAAIALLYRKGYIEAQKNTLGRQFQLLDWRGQWSLHYAVDGIINLLKEAFVGVVFDKTFIQHLRDKLRLFIPKSAYHKWNEKELTDEAPAPADIEWAWDTIETFYTQNRTKINNYVVKKRKLEQKTTNSIVEDVMMELKGMLVI